MLFTCLSGLYRIFPDNNKKWGLWGGLTKLGVLYKCMQLYSGWDAWLHLSFIARLDDIQNLITISKMHRLILQTLQISLSIWGKETSYLPQVCDFLKFNWNVFVSVKYWNKYISKCINKLFFALSNFTTCCPILTLFWFMV